ncbi:MAG: hypothetical protein RMM28_02985, partial [Thermoleophilia bacterium]|nr:hypothetical protein [Thermoleophilia bacterium]
MRERADEGCRSTTPTAPMVDTAAAAVATFAVAGADTSFASRPPATPAATPDPAWAPSSGIASASSSRTTSGTASA